MWSNVRLRRRQSQRRKQPDGAFTHNHVRLKHSISLLSVIAGLLLVLPAVAFAQVTVTAGSGGTNLSADKAQNATTPAFTTLGNIVITETTKGSFSGSGTLILTAPSGWRFNSPGSVTTTVTGGSGGQNVTVTGVSVSASTVTVTLTVSGTTKTDILTIIGVAVQATGGATLPATGNILRTSANPGTATISGIINGTTNFGSLSQIAGAAKVLAVATQPSATATAGSTFAQQPAVAVRDQFGNTLNAANGNADNTTVVTAARNAGTGTLQGTLTATSSNGTATFLNLSHNVATSISIDFTGTGLTSATSNTIVVSPSTATKLVFGQQPSTTTAGVAISPAITVQMQDAYSNNVLSSGISVSMTLSTGTGSLGGTTSQLTNASGLATFNDLSITTSGTKNLTAAASGLTSAVSNAFDINPSTTTQVSFVQEPTNAQAGVTISPSPTVQLKDQYGNSVLTSGVSVSISLTSGTGSLGGTTTRLTDAAGLATFTDLSIDAMGSKQLTAASSGLTSDVSAAFSVTAASASALAIVQQPTTTNAGVPISPSVTVQLKDAFSNNVTTSGVSITMSLTSGIGTLAGTVSRNTNASGVSTFDDLSINLAGSKTLTASSSGLTSAATNSYTVLPLGASKLAFLQQPSAAAANDTITPPVTVEVRDAFDNRVDTAGISIALTLTTGSGTLSGTTVKVTADTGVATFDTLIVDLIGDKRITASASGLTSAVSDTFVIAAAGTATKIAFVQQPTNAVAGQTFAPSVTVQLKDDANVNVASSGVSITISLSSGSGALSGTLTRVTNGGGLATFDDLSINLAGSKQLTASSSGLPDTTSASFVITPSVATNLAFVQQPSAAAAGSSISPSVTVQLRDAYGNDVDSSGVAISIALTSGTGTLSGTASQSTNGAGLATFNDLSIDVAGSKELTASHGSLTSAVSSSFTINPGAFTKLQTLVPGETASPGVGSGKTGTPSTRTAGTSFNVTVNAVDAYWNVVTTVTDVVGITSSDANASLPANAALVAGTNTYSVTLKTAGTATVTATDITDGGKTPSTSPSITVVAGAFTKLQLLVPGETAAPGTVSGKTGSPSARTAGTGFSVTVNAVDANWNLVSSIADIVGISSSDANATLPGNALLSSGTQTFSITLRTAGSATVTASDVTDGSKSLNTSPTVTVNAGAFSKLQLLVPGETASAGSVTGKTGSPTTQFVGGQFSVTANAVDANWNLVSSTDVVGITSSDGAATLPANAAMVAGTQSFTFSFGTAGTQTITASDITNGVISQNTSPSITVNASGTGIVTAATGGGAVSADNVGGAYTSLTGPLYTETSSGNAGTGTIILNAPSGFAFDTTTPLPTVLVTRTGGVGADTRNINNVAGGTSVAVGSVTSTQITFTVTDVSSNGVTNSLTWQNVRIRPTAGSPLATANITKSGTSTMTGVTAGTTNFGTLTEVAGTVTKLIITLPGETFTSGSGNSGTPSVQTAGTNFTIVSISATDQYSNVTTSYNGVKTLSYSGPSGEGTYTTSVSFTSGQSTTTLTTNLKKAETTTLSVNDGSISGPVSSSLTVQTGSFSKLQILVPGESAAPGTSSGKTGSPSPQTVGSSFTVTVNAVDDNWNFVSSGTDVVGITSSDGAATLPANQALVGGTKTSSVTLNTAGSKTVTASDITQPSRTANTSPAISVAAGAFVKLQILMPGETADPGSVTGKTGTPTARTAGTAFNVTVNAVDANWNVISSVTDIVGITSNDTYASLAADAALVSGTKTFSVTLTTAGSATVTVSDISDGTKTLNTSPSTTVNAGAFTKLQVIVPGESTVPGSPSGKTGTPSTQIAGSGFIITVHAVDANWNSVTSVADVVGITSSDGAATLPASAALVAGSQTFNVALGTAGSGTVTASDITDGGKAANTSSSITVSPAGTGTVTAATGGTSISADNTSGSFTTLTGPVYAESTPGNATAGTVILKAPAGFIFDTGGTAPTVLITRLVGSGPDADNINGVASGTSLAIDSINDSLITFTITSASTNGAQNSLTWQNIRVRPTQGTPLVSDTITVDTASTATMTGVTEDSTNFGLLTEVSGAMTQLFVTLPGETFVAGSGNSGSASAQSAGSSFVIPSLTAADQFKNIVTTYSGAKTISYSGPTGEASYTTGVVFTSGQSTTSLATTLKKAETTTLTADDGTINGPASSSLTVNAGAFSKLQLLVPGETAAPGTTTGKAGSPSSQAVGVAFNVTVKAVDANWNPVSSTDAVAITSSDGGASLPANANLVAGVQTFSVTLNTAGSQTVTATDATDGGKSPNTSPSIIVTPGAFTKLQILLPGETAAPGTPSGKTGSPTAQTAGTSFSVTVNAVDANWNVVSSVTDVVAITSTDTYATLPSNAALVSGTKTFSVTLKTAGTATVTATDITDGGKTPNISPSVTVNAGSFTKLQLLVPGESAVPGSPTGKTGTPASTTEGASFSVTVKSVDANWNPVTSTDVVEITSSDGTATLPANAALIAGVQTFNVTLNTAGSQTVTASDITDGGKSANTSPAITVNAAGTIQSTTTGGLWNATSTWVGGSVPTATSNVVIATTGANAVTINANVSVRTLVINSGALLQGDGSARTFSVGKSNSLSLTNNGTLNANGTSIIVATASSWEGSGTFNLFSIDLNAKTLTIAFAAPDTMSLSAAGTPLFGGGSIVPDVNCAFNFNGTAAQTIPIGTYTFSNVYSSNSAGATLGAAITTANVTGDLRVLSGTLGNGGFAVAGNAGKTFGVANGATFVLTGTSAFPTGFTADLGLTSVIAYEGTNQVIKAQDYASLELTTGGTRTFEAGTIRISGDFVVSGTTVDVTTNSVTVEFNGTSAQSIAGITYYIVVFSNAGIKTLSETATFNNLLTVQSGATFQVAATGVLNMLGIVENEGTIENNGIMQFP